MDKPSITNSIHYIYYLTYFHPYSTHPFWEEFKDEFKGEIEEKIKPCLEELKRSVKCLQEKHKSLKEIVSTYSDPKKVIEKSVETIRCDINFIECDLNCYVVEELLRIKVQLECKKRDFDQKIKSSDKIISLCVTEIINILVVIRRITLTLKMTGYFSFRDNRRSSSFYHIYFETTDTSIDIQKTISTGKLERRLQVFVRDIKALIPSKLPSLEDLTRVNPCVDNNKGIIDDKIKNSINKIEICLNYLEGTIDLLTRRQKTFLKIVKVVETKEDKTERKGSDLSLSDRSQDSTGKSAIFWVYYDYVVNIKETIIKYTEHIHEIKTLVVTEIDKLVEQVKPFKDKLKTVKEQLEDLQSIRFFSEQLKNHQSKDVYISGKGALRKIIRISYQLKYVGHDFDTIKSNWKNFHHTYYSTQLSSVKTTVSNYQATLNSNHLNGTSRENPHLLRAKSALECVQNNLSSLESIGKSIPQLIKMARILTELVPFLDEVDTVISRMQKEIEQLGCQLETTGQQLEIINTFRDTVEHEIRTMEGYINEIKAVKEITEAGTEITDHYKAYTDKFEEFKKALDKLETCLDYLIKGFLRCSLCTTICRLKRQLRDGYSKCSNTTDNTKTSSNNNTNTDTKTKTTSDCNTCLRHSLVNDKVNTVEEVL